MRLALSLGVAAFTEPFSSSDFAGLKNVDGLGQLPGAPGTAAELAQDAPGFELGIGALARGAEPGMSAVSVLLRGRLVPPPVRRADIVLAEVALIAQHDQAAGGQCTHDAPDPGGGQVCTAPGSGPDTHTMSPSGLAMTCRFIPCLRCLPE